MSISDRFKQKRIKQAETVKPAEVKQEESFIEPLTEHVIEPEKSAESSFSSIFDDAADTALLLEQLAKERRNIIFVCQKSFEKIITADKIKAGLKNENACIITGADYNLENLNGRINILPNPDIHTIVKAFEQIIYGCGSFILGLNLGSFDNIINKLKVLISLNYKNLSSEDIITLIGAANPVIAYISKSEKGLLYISEISEIKLNETGSLELSEIRKNAAVKETIESPEVNKEPFVQIQEEIIEDSENQPKEEEEIIEEAPSAPLENEPLKNIDLDKEADSFREEINAEVIPEEKTEAQEDEKPKKANKYEMLKEKVRQRKISRKSNINPKV